MTTTRLGDTYRHTAGMVNTDTDKPCSPGERVEFVLAFMHLLYLAKLDLCIQAGDVQQTKDCETYIKLFAGLQSKFSHLTRGGTSKEAAGAEVFTFLNKLDAAGALP